MVGVLNTEGPDYIFKDGAHSKQFFPSIKKGKPNRNIYSWVFKTIGGVQRGPASLMVSRAEAAYPGQSLFKHPRAKNRTQMN